MSEPHVSGNGTQPVVVVLGHVEPERVTWLWPGRIPAGKLTLLVGDPEAGKSTIALDIAARVTTQRPFPDGSPCPLGDVLYLTLEDGLADTVRPRLDAAGANAYRVHSITAMWSEEHGESGLTLPADLPAIGQVCEERGITLVVLDPIKGFLTTGNEWRDGDVRRALGPLAAFAERTGIAVLAIVHLTKASGTPAQYRVSGSIAFTAAARSVLLAAPDPGSDNGRRVLAPLKCSLCRHPSTLAYTLAAPDGSSDGPAAVLWAGESPVTARQALAVPVDGEERSQTDDAADWLLVELGDGPRPAKELQRRARDAGHSDKALRRGRERLGVRPQRVGFGAGGEWVWRLPIDAHTPSIDGLDAHTQDMGSKDAYGPEGASMPDYSDPRYWRSQVAQGSRVYRCQDCGRMESVGNKRCSGCGGGNEAMTTVEQFDALVPQDPAQAERQALQGGA